MATELVSAISYTDKSAFYGPVRLLLGALTSPPTFPVKIEDVIDLDTMDPETGYSDLGLTTPDGFTVTPEFTVGEGFDTDQLDENIGGGDVSGYKLTGAVTLRDTDMASIRTAWSLDASTTIAAVADTNVEQTMLKLGGMGSLPQRILIALQQHQTTGHVRMMAFRVARPKSAGAIKMAKNASELPLEFDLRSNGSITDGTKFGKIFQTTAAVV